MIALLYHLQWRKCRFRRNKRAYPVWIIGSLFGLKVPSCATSWSEAWIDRCWRNTGSVTITFLINSTICQSVQTECAHRVGQAGIPSKKIWVDIPCFVRDWAPGIRRSFPLLTYYVSNAIRLQACCLNLIKILRGRLDLPVRDGRSGLERNAHWVCNCWRKCL